MAAFGEPINITPATVTDVADAKAKSTATPVLNDGFLGWYDGPDTNAAKLSDSLAYTPMVTATNDVTYYARFAPGYTVNFVAQTKQADGTFLTNTLGGTVSTESATGLEGKTASSKATANSGYKFVGWYDKNGNQLSTDATYSTTTTSATNGVTYYARFALPYNPTVENKTYLSFVSEDGNASIGIFDDRDAGAGIVGGEFGNTISTGFRYSVDNMENVTTLQITVTVPADSYVKVGGTGIT